jgi:hypothetical protein
MSELDNAVQLLENVCAQVNGNLEDHRRIQGALAVIKKALEPESQEK